MDIFNSGDSVSVGDVPGNLHVNKQIVAYIDSIGELICGQRSFVLSEDRKSVREYLHIVVSCVVQTICSSFRPGIINIFYLFQL